MDLERETQKALFDWFCKQYPKLAVFFIKIDNEGKRKTIVRNGVKVPVGLYSALAQGLNPSTPDIFISLPYNEYSGLWIELKPDKWKPRSKKEKEHSEAQIERIELLRSVGYQAHFCIGALDAIDKIKDYLKK